MPTKPLVTSYRQDLRLFPDRWHKVGIALGTALLLAYPFLADDRWLTVGTLACVSVVGAVALMVLTGLAGQISLGHAAFLALGAYTAAIAGNEWGMPFWLVLPVAGLVAAAVGLAVGVFALRLKGLYLAIVTLGLVFLVNSLDRSITTPEEAAREFDVPVQGVIGEITTPGQSAARWMRKWVGWPVIGSLILLTVAVCAFNVVLWLQYPNKHERWKDDPIAFLEETVTGRIAGP